MSVGFAGLAAVPALAASNPGTGDSGFFTFRPTAAVGGAQINVASGNALVRTRDLADGPLTYHVVVDRFYNSLDPDSYTILSPRWAFDVGPDTKLTVESNQDATVRGPSGYRIRFARQTDGSYIAPDGFDGALTKTPSGWTLTRASQGDEFGFDGSGTLTWTKDSSLRDFTVQGTSAAGRTILSSYGTNSGRRVNLSYTTSGDYFVRLMDDPASGHHWYRYSGGRLSEYESPTGAITSYGYDVNGFLDEIVEPGGTTVELDVRSSGKVNAITTTLPGGVPQTTSFVYARRTYKSDVTAPDTTRRTYAYDDDWRVTRDYDPDVVPTVVASGELWNLAGEYTRGTDQIPVALSGAGPDGAGLARLAVEAVGGPEVAILSPPCTDTPFDHVCPQIFAGDATADLRGLPEGRHELRAIARDDEGNTGTGDPWSVLIDRSAPPIPGTIDAVLDEGDDIADLTWNPAADPPLPTGELGSGFDRYEFRTRPEGGTWSSYETMQDDMFPTVELGSHEAGDRIEYEINTYDKIGNVATRSGTATVSLTDVTAADSGDIAPSEAGQPLGPGDVGESDEWRDVDPDETEGPAGAGESSSRVSGPLDFFEEGSPFAAARLSYDSNLCAGDGLASPCGRYSGRAAGAYARANAMTNHGTKRNFDYAYYDSNCTNFASQVLHFGGLRYMRTAPGINDPRHQDKDLYMRGSGSWWARRFTFSLPPGGVTDYKYDNSHSWSVGWVLYNQLLEHGLARIVGGGERLRSGDIGFYWFDGPGPVEKIKHVNVVAGVRKRVVYVAQHTTDRFETLKRYDDRLLTPGTPYSHPNFRRVWLRPIATRFDLP